MFRGLLIGIVVCTSAWLSAETSCSVEIVAGLSTKKTELIQLSQADAFVPNPADIKVESVTEDMTPRRIIFVIQRGNAMKESARVVTAEIMSRVLSETRAEDEFGLITVGPGSVSMPLGSAPDKLFSEARSLLGEKKPSGKPLGLLDGFMLALEWFGQPHTGDAIYVFAGEDKVEDSKSSFAKVRDELWRRGTRVFGFHFGMPILGYSGRSFTDGRSLGDGSSFYMPNREGLLNLAWGSGGALIVENMDQPWKTYELTPERTQQLSQSGFQMYGSIVETYRLRLLRSGKAKAIDWTLDVTEEVRKKFPTAIVLYPRRLPACS